MADDPHGVMAETIRRVHDLQRRHPRVTVAIDGPDAAGKTRFAARLASRLGGDVLQASVDDFQRSRDERGRRGELSADGYYEDAFDRDGLKQHLLAPFRDGADVVAISRWDYRRDVAAERSATVPATAVLIVDGVFLQRPELRDQWDLAIYLAVSEETTLRRGVARDTADLGTVERVTVRYQERYLPGQRLYRAQVDPRAAADIVIDNEDPRSPRLVRDPG